VKTHKLVLYYKNTVSSNLKNYYVHFSVKNKIRKWK